jgi:predicted acetyltransferase
MSLEHPTIESLRNGDEPAKFELSRQAFGTQDAVDLARPRPTNDRIVAAYDGDTIVGCVTLLHDAQYFGAQPVTSGGIASVSVAAHARGRNVARRMMREALDRLHAGGCAISALYPTTATLYRSVGYEIAGHHGISQIDIGDLPRSMGTITFAPVSIGELRDAYDAVAFTHDGWLVRNDARWTIVTYDFDKSPQPKAAYLAHRDGRLVGGVAYRQVPGERRSVDLMANQLFAVDRPALREVLALLGAHGTMAGSMRTPLPEWELQAAVDNGQRVKRTFAMPWMVRMVDAAAAVAQRGYNPHVDVEVELELTDDLFTHNTGRFVLRVRKGSGSLEAGGRGLLALDIREFAAAFTGQRTLEPGLTAAFGGARPTLVDFF